ncbi:hypothetical protein FAIPA1_80156 [Frankia sp. AiPs1]|uniref:hypothetical protein n=1 Tax=Frankia sp. AiPa1 TaxID=573492 RepID=UPI00202B653C|nr:hypothetical protein [Frankia sp. AiPa1]MCL9760496.1 hypothetical protein [Frankia sp. AiPa1]
MTEPAGPAGAPGPDVPMRPARRRGGDSRMASRIGLWGAQTSGKTTMLAALHAAMTQQSGEDEKQDWILFAGNTRTSDFLAKARSDIARREFPAANLYEARDLSLRMMRPRRSGLLRRLTRRPPLRTEFELTLMDVSGQMYNPTVLGDNPDLYADESEAGDAVEKLVDHLARADGLVYLFDPVRELDNQDSYQYLETMLERVLQRADELGRMPDGKLPHYLAVCISKLDDRRVFHRAYDGGFVSAGDDDAMMPVVTSEDAADFFQYLCSRETMGRHAGSGPKVRGSIERHFHPGRVRYFASSSIGFYVGRTGMFRVQDFENVEKVDGRTRIRGDVRPTGVLEPVLWLVESIRSDPPPAAEAITSDGPSAQPGPQDEDQAGPASRRTALRSPRTPRRSEDEAFAPADYGPPPLWHRDDDVTTTGPLPLPSPAPGLDPDAFPADPSDGGFRLDPVRPHSSPPYASSPNVGDRHSDDRDGDGTDGYRSEPVRLQKFEIGDVRTHAQPDARTSTWPDAAPPGQTSADEIWPDEASPGGFRVEGSQPDGYRPGWFLDNGDGDGYGGGHSSGGDGSGGGGDFGGRDDGRGV